MSTRIALAFRESAHPILCSAGLKVLRLTALVRFFQGTAWSESLGAIVDTGSPVSVLPEFVWRRIERRAISIPPHTIGLAGRMLSVELAEVQCAAVDKQAASPPFSLRAYLCHGDTDLLLLGMEDLLTRASLFCEHASRTAYLEFP